MTKRSINYNGYSICYVQNYTKVSARRLRWWEQQGLIGPSAKPRRKSGQRRLYTLRDILCILVIKSLREKGVSLQKIRESVERIRVTGVDLPLAKLRVACLAHTIAFKKDGKFVEPISGQLVIEEALEIIRPHFSRKRLVHVERAVDIAGFQYQKKLSEF